MYLSVVRITCNYLWVDKYKMIQQSTWKYVKNSHFERVYKYLNDIMITDSMMPIGYLKVIYKMISNRRILLVETSYVYMILHIQLYFE